MKNDPKWLNKQEYPFQSHFINISGQKMHYIDEGEGETLLFVHGTPSWSFEYRNVIRNLCGNYRCIAIDHIGFGLSDKPEHYNYSLERHSKNLEAFIYHMELKNIILVVHDFGGPIGLHYAVKHPENISRIVLFNTWAWNPVRDVNVSLLTSKLLAFLYRRLNFSPRFIMPASFGERKLSKEIRKHYCRPFSKPSERNGMVAFAQSLATEGKWFTDLWRRLYVLRNIPALFIWGMKDRFITSRYLDKLSSVFARAEINKLASAGHFPQEEEPYQVSHSIRSFIELGVHVHAYDPEIE